MNDSTQGNSRKKLLLLAGIAFIPLYIAEFLCHIIFVNQILTDALIRPFLSCISVFIIFQALKYFDFNEEVQLCRLLSIYIF